MPSIAIAAHSYDAEVRKLHITYAGGRSYAYLDVAPEVYARFLNAFSKGVFVNRIIKPNYRCERVSETAPPHTAPDRRTA